jgi:hypothetical protein
MKPSASAKWRNWQTHQTQNLAHFTVRVGSTPTFATKTFPIKFDTIGRNHRIEACAGFRWWQNTKEPAARVSPDKGDFA